MPFVDTPGARIYYETHGRAPAEGPAVVFAHGAGGNHLSWWQQVPYFERDYACVVFDHRGFGRSDDIDGRGGAGFADDLRALLDHLGIERAHLVAQSMGGWTCLRFAIEQPERVVSLVLSDTHGGLTTPEIEAALRVPRDYAPPLPPDVHPAAGARMAEEQPSLCFLYAEIDALNPPRDRAQLGALIQSAGTVTREEALALPVPVLFIAGEEDIVIPPHTLAAAEPCFRDARLERVPAAGHSVYFERADTYNSLVGAFLASTLPHRNS